MSTPTAASRMNRNRADKLDSSVCECVCVTVRQTQFGQ